MKNIVSLININIKRDISVRVNSLSKKKKVIFIFLFIAVAVFSIPSSLIYGERLCRHFTHLGAVDKAPSSFYAVFTLYALIYNISNGNRFFLAEKEKSSDSSNDYGLMLSKLAPIYIYNLALAFYFVFLPLIIYGSHTDTSNGRIVVSLLFAPILPLFPMAISTPFVIILPRNRNALFRRWLNVLLFVAFLILMSVFGNTVLQALSDNAYTLSMCITKYYFPAAFFEGYIAGGSGMLLFIVSNIAAFCLAITLLTKTNKINIGGHYGTN